MLPLHDIWSVADDQHIGYAGSVRRQNGLKATVLANACLDYHVDIGERIMKEGGAQVCGLRYNTTKLEGRFFRSVPGSKHIHSRTCTVRCPFNKDVSQEVLGRGVPDRIRAVLERSSIRYGLVDAK
jgi:hypothetical protein